MTMAARLALVACLAGFVVAAGAADTESYCPVFYPADTPPDNCETQLPDSLFRPTSSASAEYRPRDSDLAGPNVLEDVFEALEVLQREYYDANYGTWPSAIDWTAAVTQTVLTGTLSTFSKSAKYLGGVNDWVAKENLISSFFAQVVGSYFGQDILSIRGEAYDDILWVVLGWIEAIKLVNTHSELHYPPREKLSDQDPGAHGLREFMESLPWHGHNWISSFAHRSRVFWNLASRGWDTNLCHGGMLWNPRLAPYKNAITNELWISASIAMYRHFPGDNFTSPWLTATTWPKKDPAHLSASVEGYRWLMGINMTNSQGLFVDGFHIDTSSNPNNVECDLRDEMVYTYNQGVVLTGQRELWAATGAVSYLDDGHRLVRNVMNATGWDIETNAPQDVDGEVTPELLPPWRGLGRGGVMEESCDADGSCSQDGQTFKGIFFHHLSAFCEPLPRRTGDDDGQGHGDMVIDTDMYVVVATSHADACASYVGWVRRNALAAASTRDERGLFGMWWGAGLARTGRIAGGGSGDGVPNENMTDYRNKGTPSGSVWGQKTWQPGTGAASADVAKGYQEEQQARQQVFGSNGSDGAGVVPLRGDPNSRGRGRTVETQVGGLAVLRAYWDLSRGARA